LEPLSTVMPTVCLGKSSRRVRTASTDLPAFAKCAAQGKPIDPEPSM
jgi:hypothetical protein